MIIHIMILPAKKNILFLILFVNKYLFFNAAGKTGTAENEGKYAHAWFVGYSNVEDPDLVVCVLVENVGAGSKYAVPIAKRVFDSYYNNNMKEYYSQKTDIESTQTNQ